jgi:ParB family chromosome partitioning protein
MLSTLNVRQTERAADVDSLAEDIAARGLKQNLVVVPAHYTSGEASEAQRQSCKPAPGGTGPWVGRFEVIAGGRRFQALQLLVRQGRLSATLPVPCMIECRDAASETSLSENLHRVAMNPADEFDAYRVIVNQAKRNGSDPDPIAYCAKRFGVAVKHVNGRLRLASLAPEILEALRANAIGVESAKAYASVEDHALQLKVFEAQKKSTWQPHAPAQVKNGLRGETLSVNDPIVKFVGIDDYTTAGGRTEVEMFMGTDAQERVIDVKLLEKMAWEKAEPMVAPAAKADGFKSGIFARGVASYAKTPKEPDGMERVPSWGEQPTKAQRKKCIGVYAIASSGTVLDHIATFKPARPRKDEPARDWEAERAEQQRQFGIERRAAQLAVYELGKFAGTPFEGHAFWPAAVARPVAVEIDDEAHAMVAVLVRVPVDRINANREEAERLIAEETAAAKAKKAEDEAAEAQRREEIDSALDDPETQAEDQADADA